MIDAVDASCQTYSPSIALSTIGRRNQMGSRESEPAFLEAGVTMPANYDVVEQLNVQ